MTVLFFTFSGMRIYITGPGGSGKSTLAQKLGQHYNVPVVHLDTLQWQENWVENEDYRTLQQEAIAEPNWVIEWASCSIIPAMKDSVDFIVLLNYPSAGNILRIIKRLLKELFLRQKRVGLDSVNTNRLTLDFLLRTARYKTRQLPRIRKNISDSFLDGKLIEFKSPKNAFERILSVIAERDF